MFYLTEIETLNNNTWFIYLSVFPLHGLDSVRVVFRIVHVRQSVQKNVLFVLYQEPPSNHINSLFIASESEFTIFEFSLSTSPIQSKTVLM